MRGVAWMGGPLFSGAKGREKWRCSRADQTGATGHGCRTQDKTVVVFSCLLLLRWKTHQVEGRRRAAALLLAARSPNIPWEWTSSAICEGSQAGIRGSNEGFPRAHAWLVWRPAKSQELTASGAGPPARQETILFAVRSRALDMSKAPLARSRSPEAVEGRFCFAIGAMCPKQFRLYLGGRCVAWGCRRTPVPFSLVR